MQVRINSCLILICLFLLSANVVADDLRSTVNYLTSDNLEGRLIGTVGEERATQYIADYFARLGLLPAGENGTYFQTVDFVYHKKKWHGRNVLAKLRVGDSTGNLIVLGAHADHLGHGEFSGSRAHANEKGMIHAGADDNASGVASMLFAAKELVQLKAQAKLAGNRDILFAAWSGEEFGILGSSHFVKNTKQKIEVNINLDMIGRLRDGLIVQGVGSSVMWPMLLKHANNHHLKLILQQDPYLPTDSTAFYVRGIPSINFFTGAHDEYHSPRDTAETLNYTGIKQISVFLVNTILAVENKPTNLSFHAIKQKLEHKTSALKVYLGTIPDYAGGGDGVKLSGVSKDSPAERCGLRRDDIVVSLAGREVHDIYDYTRVLNSLMVGSAVKLGVLRDSRKMDLQIIPLGR